MKEEITKQLNARSYNIGTSDYAEHKIQPWDIWEEYKLNPWDADIIKRVLRTKRGESRSTEYLKIIHNCEERIRQIRASEECPKNLKNADNFNPLNTFNTSGAFKY